MKKHRQKLQTNGLWSLLICLVVILFLSVGSSLAQQVTEEELTTSDEQVESLYQDFWTQFSQAEEGSKGVPYFNSSSKQAFTSDKVSEADQKIIKQEQLLHSQDLDVPAGDDYRVVNGNVPLFTSKDLESQQNTWEAYSPLDDHNRVGPANALLGSDLMPADEDSRDSLSHVEPTGWRQMRYPGQVEGSWLYNRSHLIGYQLTGQQANVLNLLTATRAFNVEGMLPFENYVAAYIENNDVHVRYRVTPVFIEDELLARGVYMEGYSIEDNGRLAFHIYVPNRQPGIHLNYKDGSSHLE